MKENINIKVSLRDNPDKENSNLKAFASITLSGVTITNVRVIEKKSKIQTAGKYLDFNMPARSREMEDGTKEYRNLAEVTCKNEETEKILKKEIRNAIKEAYNSTPSADGFKRAELTSQIEADMDYTKVYAQPVQTNNNYHLRAFATAYIGGIVKLNNLSLTSGINKQTGEIFQTINFPSNKDMNGEYHDITFTTKDIRENIKNATLIDLELQNKEKENEEILEDGEDMVI